MLENFFFAGVGGTKLSNIIKQINGEELPKRKKYMGNQWEKMKRKNPDPHFAILIAGSNDCDEVDRYAKSRYRRGITDHEHRKETSLGLIQWYKDLKEHQIELVGKVRSLHKGVRIYFLPILPRRWWGIKARKMAILLNKHMLSMENTQVLNVKDLYVFKELNLSKDTIYNEDIHNGLLDYGRTHLNEWGYHLLTKKSVLSLSSCLYEANSQSEDKHTDDKREEEHADNHANDVAREKPRTRRYRRTLAKNKKQASNQQ